MDENEKENKKNSKWLYGEARQDLSLQQQNQSSNEIKLVKIVNDYRNLNTIGNENSLKLKDNNNSSQNQNLDQYGKEIFMN